MLSLVYGNDREVILPWVCKRCRDKAKFTFLRSHEYLVNLALILQALASKCKLPRLLPIFSRFESVAFHSESSSFKGVEAFQDQQWRCKTHSSFTYLNESFFLLKNSSIFPSVRNHGPMARSRENRTRFAGSRDAGDCCQNHEKLCRSHNAKDSCKDLEFSRDPWTDFRVVLPWFIWLY